MWEYRMLNKALRDKRLTVWHISLLLAILLIKMETKAIHEIKVSRKKIMDRCHIGSIVTYHKCMKELQQYCYFQYFPSYHPGIRSTILFV